MNKLYKIGKFLLSSAPFALLLSLMLFWVEQVENNKHTNKMLQEMTHIESSLSTRHIGIFPTFIGDINSKILNPDLKQDSIIIFEDLLFYGAFSNPDGFVKMTTRLLDLSENNKITIAFYENEGTYRDQMMFYGIIKETWFEHDYLNQALIEYDNFGSDTTFCSELQHDPTLRSDTIRAVVDQMFFDKSREDNPRLFKRQAHKMHSTKFNYSTPEAKKYESIFINISQIIDKYLGKDFKDQTFNDMYNLYSEMTNVMRTAFEEKGIKLIPIRTPLMMSCWSNNGDAIFAMPGRFAADEIGFITHDEQILKYFRTIIDGIEHEENCNTIEQ